MPDIPSLPAGSWPQWLLLVVVALGFIRWLWPWRADEMRKLRKEVQECRDECDAKLKALEAELWGEKRQRVAEQISFVSVVLQSVDSPELQKLLRNMESVQTALRLERAINGEVKPDA